MALQQKAQIEEVKMMFWKKKFKCNHYWHHLQDTFIFSHAGGMVDTEAGCYILCSKCEKEDLVQTEVWERIKKRQEILETNRW